MEGALEHEGGLGGQDDAAVGDAVGEHGLIGAQKDGHGLHKEHSRDGDGHAQADGGEDEEREVTVRAVTIPLAHGLGHQGGAARPQHEAAATQNLQEGPYEVDGGEGGLAYEIGHEKTVYYAVDGGEDHHNDGR